jgi:very-short-patch-repair endonuclease
MLLDALDRCDGVAHVETLRELGVPPGVSGAAVRTGLVLRPRRGWVASAAADPELLAAVSAGGRLGCASQARRLGLWVLDEPGLHLSIPRHSGHARPPADAVVHWRGREWRSGHATADPVETVLRDLADCLSLEAALCVIDSALNKGLIGLAELERALSDTRRGARLLPLADPAAESGLETIVRCRLLLAGILSRSQVQIDGIGRVDLLVGDRLIIECDGRAHHDDPLARARDRHRDLLLSARGYLVIRLDIAQIQGDWMLTLAVIRDLLARGQHLWSAAGVRTGG